jgi:hypothetical protein
MGAVYDIYLELKGDPDKDEIVRQTKRFIEDYSDRATFDVSRDGENEFIKTLRIIFTDSFDIAYVEDEDGNFVQSVNCYTADFSARYAWHSTMEDWFKAVAHVLGNGTSLNIWSDDGATFGIVYNGKAYFRYSF